MDKPRSYVKNSADPKQVKAAEKKVKRDRQQYLNDLETILRTPAGRRDRWAILEKCGLHRTSFAGENTHQTAFNEGQRNIGQILVNDILEIDPAIYALMQSEAVRDQG